MFKRSAIFNIFIIFIIFASGCSTIPPRDVNNICNIFKERPKWYWAAQDTEKQWGIPIHVMMAIIHQESKFDPSARPQRTKLLWVIPWTRPSSLSLKSYINCNSRHLNNYNTP